MSFENVPPEWIALAAPVIWRVDEPEAWMRMQTAKGLRALLDAGMIVAGETEEGEGDG